MTQYAYPVQWMPSKSYSVHNVSIQYTDSVCPQMPIQYPSSTLHTLSDSYPVCTNPLHSAPIQYTEYIQDTVSLSSTVWPQKPIQWLFGILCSYFQNTVVCLSSTLYTLRCPEDAIQYTTYAVCLSSTTTRIQCMNALLLFPCVSDVCIPSPRIAD